MAIYYKFGSVRDYDSIPIEGLFISIRDLKEEIIKSKRLESVTVSDLLVTDAQTGEEYCDESVLIPKNTSVLICRVSGQPCMPLVTAQLPEPIEPMVENRSDDQSLKIGHVGDGFGDDVYDIPSSSHGSGRGYGHGMAGGSFGVRDSETPYPGYVCHRCNVPGHSIQKCPTNGDPNYDNKRAAAFRGFPSTDERYMMPVAMPPTPYNPYWNITQPGMAGLMGPYGEGNVPYIEFGDPGPSGMLFAPPPVLPHGPFTGLGYRPPPPPPVLPHGPFTGLGYRPPPLQSGGQPSMKRTELQRKRRFESREKQLPRGGEGEYGGSSSSSWREVISQGGGGGGGGGDVSSSSSSLKAKKAAHHVPSSSEHLHHRRRSEKLLSPPRRWSRYPELSRPSSKKRNSDHHGHHDRDLDDHHETYKHHSKDELPRPSSNKRKLDDHRHNRESVCDRETYKRHSKDELPNNPSSKKRKSDHHHHHHREYDHDPDDHRETYKLRSKDDYYSKDDQPDHVDDRDSSSHHRSSSSSHHHLKSSTSRKTSPESQPPVAAPKPSSTPDKKSRARAPKKQKSASTADDSTSTPSSAGFSINT